MVLYDKGPLLVATQCALFPVASLVMACRIYTRGVMLKSWALDDTLMGIAWALNCVNTGATIYGCELGIGAHMDRFASSLRYAEATKIFLTWLFLSAFTASWTKFSILYSIRRIATRKPYIYAIYFMALLLFVSGWTTDIYVLTHCKSSAGSSDPFIESGIQCNSRETLVWYSYMFSGVSGVVDWFCVITAAFTMLELRMNTKSNLLAIILLSLGVIASTTTVYRIPVFKNIVTPTDYLYNNASVVLWSNLEINLGMITGGVATLRPLVGRFLRLDSHGGRATSESRGFKLPRAPLAIRRMHRQRAGSTESGFELIDIPTSGPKQTETTCEGVEEGGEWEKTSDDIALESGLPTHDGMSPPAGIQITRTYNVSDRS